MLRQLILANRLHGSGCSRTIHLVTAQTLTAVAAVAAAVISLVNVGLTSIFSRRQAGVKWLRDLLPDVIVRFTDAAFRFERDVFESDWTKLTHEER